MAKSKYETHVKPKLDIVSGWARNGLTLEQIAKNLGISQQSLFTYREKHVEFFEALKIGINEADIAVENALYKSAMGFEYEETKMIVEADGKKRVEKTKKYYPPNQTAQIFWLKNRKPKQWRDKQHVFQQSTQVQKFEYDNLTDEDLDKEEQVLEAVETGEIEDFDLDGELH